MSPSPTVERHQMVGEQVVRAVKSALDSLQRDLPATGRVIAIGELREALRLMDQEPPDAP